MTVDQTKRWRIATPEPLFPAMRYGIYGGAFDPIHWGHLLLAESCLRQAKLDRVVFVPTGVSPHRNGKNSYIASAEERFEMIESALAGYEEYLISRFETDRRETSFTVDTLRYFKHTFSLVEPELFLLLGADMFNDLPNWHAVDEICRLATPLVVFRAGDNPPYFEGLSGVVSPDRIEEIRQASVRMPQIELSSTEIRRAVAEGNSIRFQVPRTVETYISAHRLYRGVKNSD